LKKWYLVLFWLIYLPILGQNKSLFSEGKWLKIKIQQDDIYTLNQAFFKKYGIDISGISLRNIQIYAGPTGMLDQKNSKEIAERLTEIPYFTNDTDGKFDKNDFLKFYGQGPNQTNLTSTEFVSNHTFENFAYYFIRLGDKPGKIIQPLAVKSATAEVISRAEVRVREEKELRNILGSGRDWYGDFFYNTYAIKYKLSDALSTVKCELGILGVGGANQLLEISKANELIETEILPKADYNPADAFDRYSRVGDPKKIGFELGMADIDLKLKLATENSANAGAYIDYFQFSYVSKLKAVSRGSAFYFVKKEQIDLVSLNISDFTKNTQVWNITQDLDPQLSLLSSDGNATVNLNSGLNRILLNDLSFSLFPLACEKIENTDIFNIDPPQLLIVFPSKFKEAAKELAKHKSESQKTKTQALNVTEIYNSLSGGKVDISAIRDYCKFLFNKDSSAFKNLILMGSASFDYKNNQGLAFNRTSEQIPTYQSRESLEPIYSYCSDDFYGFLEDHEGLWSEGVSEQGVWLSDLKNDHTLDIAIGRLPVKTAIEASQMVQKIISYDLKNQMNTAISFVADNRDFNTHTDNSENLAQIAKTQFGGFDISKIYVDQYELTDAKESPAAAQSLVKNIEKGPFLINYAGHGSESGWAQEKLFTFKEILNLKNAGLPIFFTATCQFGKFDNPAQTSGAELTLLNPVGGGIAILTTTRPVYASSNEKINQAFYKNISNFKTLGELFKQTKNSAILGEINRNFTLLGDPTLKLPTFLNQVEILKINENPPANIVLEPLKPFKITGRVAGIKNGKVKIEIYDKALTNKTLGSFDDSKAFEYQTQNQILVQKSVDVLNEIFETEITLPVNMLPGQGRGNMTLKAESSDGKTSKLGSFSDFLINNTKTILLGESKPSLQISKTADSQVTIKASDDKGLYAGNDEFANELIIDDSLRIDLNSISKFNAALNSFEVAVNLEFLAAGKHVLLAKVLDIDNNKSEQSLEINILKPKIELKSVVVFPNPVESFTQFKIQHNRSSEDLSAQVTIFDIDGKVYKKITNTCKKCESIWTFGVDFENIVSTEKPLLYKIDLSSSVDFTKTTVSGRLLVLK
jgi:hypothetical protein